MSSSLEGIVTSKVKAPRVWLRIHERKKKKKKTRPQTDIMPRFVDKSERMINMSCLENAVSYSFAAQMQNAKCKMQNAILEVQF